jgi:hypothetical protein
MDYGRRSKDKEDERPQQLKAFEWKGTIIKLEKHGNMYLVVDSRGDYNSYYKESSAIRAYKNKKNLLVQG